MTTQQIKISTFYDAQNQLTASDVVDGVDKDTDEVNLFVRPPDSHTPIEVTSNEASFNKQSSGAWEANIPFSTNESRKQIQFTVSDGKSPPIDPKFVIKRKGG